MVQPAGSAVLSHRHSSIRSSRTAFRLWPKVITNSRLRRYFPVAAVGKVVRYDELPPDVAVPACEGVCLVLSPHQNTPFVAERHGRKREAVQATELGGVVAVVAYADETRLVLSPAEQWSRHWPMRLSIRPRPSVIMLSLAPLSKS